jgi:hypothetical protein
MKINVLVCACLLLFPVAGLAQPTQKTGPATADASAGVLKIVAKDDTSLMWLAHIWSGGQTEAQCRNTAAAGMPSLLPGERYCELNSSTHGTVGLQTNVDGAVDIVTFTRLSLSHADAQKITDSLDVILRSHGLAGRACHREPMDGLAMIWESQDLLVYLARITLTGQLPKLSTIAVRETEAFPPAFCRPIEKTVSPTT